MPDAELAEPIVLYRKGIGGRSYAHHVVEVGANARATLVIDHRGLIQVAANIEFVIGDGAQLSVVAVNACRRGIGPAVLVRRARRPRRELPARQHHARRLGRADRARRCGSPARVAAPSCSASASPATGQHFESRLYIDHAQPNCTSDVLYKNALLGESARTVWIGDVRIRPAATGTSTYEMNRNLLLSDGARADSVPNLEIETGEIAGAGHASATGRFDDLQMFYLQSRGIIPRTRRGDWSSAGSSPTSSGRIGLPDMQQQHHDRHRGPAGLHTRAGDRVADDCSGDPRPARLGRRQADDAPRS